MEKSELRREDYVVAFIPKEAETYRHILCNACRIYKKLGKPSTSGYCRVFMCAGGSVHRKHFIHFDNSIHVPMVTLDKCNVPDCNNPCHNCVMHLKFGIGKR